MHFWLHSQFILAHLPSYDSATIGTFAMRGKQPGAPGTPGVPEPSPSYPPADNAQGGDHIYELEDEPIVSHEIISS